MDIQAFSYNASAFSSLRIGSTEKYRLSRRTLCHSSRLQFFFLVSCHELFSVIMSLELRLSLCGCESLLFCSESGWLDLGRHERH